MLFSILMNNKKNEGYYLAISSINEIIKRESLGEIESYFIF